MRPPSTLARRGLGRTCPNPPVGAVFVRGGRVVGEGFHRRAGAPHAEVEALARPGAARGATLYVTLEPCTHHGRTPPCATRCSRRAPARRGRRRRPEPARARARHRAPAARRHRRPSGRAKPTSAGAHPGFARHVRGRPFVRLKLAASARRPHRDAAAATRAGSPGPRRGAWRTAARRLDAVLVGAGTVRADDPALTCRRAGGRDPVRVVVDAALRTPPRARSPAARPLAGVDRHRGVRHDARAAGRLARAGATVLPGRRAAATSPRRSRAGARHARHHLRARRGRRASSRRRSLARGPSSTSSAVRRAAPARRRRRAGDRARSACGRSTGARRCA